MLSHLGVDFWKGCQMDTFQRYKRFPFQREQEQRNGKRQWKKCEIEFFGVDFLRSLSLITHLEENLSDVGCRSRQV